jgi:hypothetical protein
MRYQEARSEPIHSRGPGTRSPKLLVTRVVRGTPTGVEATTRGYPPEWQGRHRGVSPTGSDPARWLSTRSSLTPTHCAGCPRHIVCKPGTGSHCTAIVAGSFPTHDGSCRLGSEPSTSREDPLPFDALTLRLSGNPPTQRGDVLENTQPIFESTGAICDTATEPTNGYS